MKTIGRDSKQNEIFYCSKMHDNNMPTLAFVAGLHGNEPAGVYGLYEFLKTASNIDKNIIMIPLMNPHGFEKNIRRNSDGKDLNRQWDKSELKIVNRVKKLMKKINPDFLFSLHEDGTAGGYYVYGSKIVPNRLLKKITSILNKHLDPVPDGEIYGDKVKDGIVVQNNEEKPKHYKSMEYYFEKNGIPSITVEIPSDLPLKKRKLIYKKLIEEIVNFVN